MTLPVKKIYIDSRYRTLDSTSSSSFKFPLARNLYFPKNTVFYLEDVCIPHTWLTIEAGINDRFYIRYRTSGLNGLIPSDGGTTYPYPNLSGWVDKFVTLAPGVYTCKGLATQLQFQLSALTSLSTILITISSEPTTNTIKITPIVAGVMFFIPTDFDLSTKLNGYWNLPTQVTVNTGAPVSNINWDILMDYDINNTHSCNEVFNNNGFVSPLYTDTTPYTSSFLNLTLINNIYISSPNLGSYSTLGSRGESNILKKVPVSGSYGTMIIDSFTSNHDFLDCSDQCLSTIEFNLKDVKGNLIPLHGSNVSFSIVFASHNEDGMR